MAAGIFSEETERAMPLLSQSSSCCHELAEKMNEKNEYFSPTCDTAGEIAMRVDMALSSPNAQGLRAPQTAKSGNLGATARASARVVPQPCDDQQSEQGEQDDVEGTSPLIITAASRDASCFPSNSWGSFSPGRCLWPSTAAASRLDHGRRLDASSPATFAFASESRGRQSSLASSFAFPSQLARSSPAGAALPLETSPAGFTLPHVPPPERSVSTNSIPLFTAVAAFLEGDDDGGGND